VPPCGWCRSSQGGPKRLAASIAMTVMPSMIPPPAAGMPVNGRNSTPHLPRLRGPYSRGAWAPARATAPAAGPPSAVKGGIILWVEN
jgi:hypothetical protein